MPHAPNPSPALRRSARPWIWAAGVLVLAVFAAYANAVRAPFVYDDTLAIPQNPSIRRLWALGDVLWPKVEGGVTVSGRPVLNLSFALNHAVSGTDVWSYHVTNILIHAGAALLLLGIVRRTADRCGAGLVAQARTEAQPSSEAERLAFAVAAFWAVHPLLTQAVTYTVQRAESLMGFFYLLTVYAFARGVAERLRYGWLVLSVGACALGMGTKEVMVTAPVIVLLYDRTFVVGSFTAAWRARRGYYGALAATWLVLAAVMIAAGGNRGGTVGLGTGVPLWAYPLTQFEALVRYLALSLWPTPLVFEYGTTWAKRAWDVLPFAAVVLPLLGATAVALTRRRVTGFLGAWFFVILAPTSLAPGTIQMIVEHRMYLPLAGVIALLVLGLHRVTGARAWWAVGAAAAALLALTVRRNHDYRSNLALWNDTVAKRPMNPRGHEGLAEALAAAGRMDEAIKVRERSVSLLPDESQYHYNLALTLADAGRRDEAARAYQESLRLYPNEARTHNNLAILLAQLGRTEEALPHYKAAVRLRPAEALYHYNYGIALMRARNWSEAEASFRAATQLRGDYADAYFNLAAALVRLNRPGDAIEAYATAARLRPEDVDYAVGHASALLLAGHAEESSREFQRALRLRPDSIEAMSGAGNALVALRRYAEAIAQFEAVLRRAPENAAAHFKLGNALLDVDRVTEAIPHYEAAIKIAPNDAEAWHNLGIAFARLERWEEARRGFDEALRLKPDYADARRSREQLRQVTGR